MNNEPQLEPTSPGSYRILRDISETGKKYYDYVDQKILDLNTEHYPLMHNVFDGYEMGNSRDSDERMISDPPITTTRWELRDCETCRVIAQREMPCDADDDPETIFHSLCRKVRNNNDLPWDKPESITLTRVFDYLYPSEEVWELDYENVPMPDTIKQ